MKNLMLAAIVICATACANGTRFSSPSAPAKSDNGNEQGNGSDYIRYGDGSAWFINPNKTIRYCLELSPSFGVDEGHALDAIETAISRWYQYIQSKQIYGKDPKPYQITTRYERINRCDGTQDLAFYFGVSNAQSSGYLSKTGNSVASAVRISYDEFKAWGKGFVWVASLGSIAPDYSFGYPSRYPDWSVPNNLVGILTHELGHVNGTEHVDGTIMRADIADYLRGSGDQAPPWDRNAIDSIDDSQELYICDDCNITYAGTIGYDVQTTTSTQGTVSHDTVTATFTLLTGHAPVGGPTAVHGQLVGNVKTGFVLKFADASQTFDIPIQLQYETRVRYQDHRNVFKVVVSSTSDGANGTFTKSTMREFRAHEGYTVNGTLTTLSGQTLSVELNRNMSNPFSLVMPNASPLTITYVQGESVQPIFIGNIPTLN